MINYFRNGEIDRQSWDSCVEQSNSGKPYGYSWYLDIMAPGWEALIDDDYEAVFPIPCFSKYSVSYIATPVFLQKLGAYSPDSPGEGALEEFIDFLPQFYRFIDLCVTQKIEYKGFRVTERSNFVLDLSRQYEKLNQGFTSDCRRNISLAAKKRGEITGKVKPSELIDLFLRNKGSEILGVKPRDYEKLEQLMNYCLSAGHGEIIGVRGGRKRLIHGVFVVSVKGSKTLLFTAGSPESREKRTGYLVVDELIRKYSGTKNLLDFAGSSIPSVASFMQSFGSRNVPYYRMYRNSLPLFIRWLK